jgi:hypothetical protein
MAAMSPVSISAATSRIRVNPNLQVSTHAPPPAPSRATTSEKLATLTLATPPSPPSTSSSPSNPDLDLSHVFAIGDCADTGAIQAGHTAYWQSEVAARNIIRLINAQDGGEGEELEVYKPGPAAIKVSLGLQEAVTANGDEVVVSEEGVEDLKAMTMW